MWASIKVINIVISYVFVTFKDSDISSVPPDHLLLDRSSNIGPVISCWELDKLKNCWNKSFRTSKILTLFYQKFSNLLISQRDMSGPRLGTLSNNRWSGGSFIGNNFTWTIAKRNRGWQTFFYQSTALLALAACARTVFRYLEHHPLVIASS